MTTCLLSELRRLDLVASAALPPRWHLQLGLLRQIASPLELSPYRLLDLAGQQHSEETLRLEGEVDSAETLLLVAEELLV